MEDSGIFAAVAENRGGAAKCSANLVVEERRQGRGGLVPPSFLTTIQDAFVKAGQLVRFDAKVSNYNIIIISIRCIKTNIDIQLGFR